MKSEKGQYSPIVHYSSWTSLFDSTFRALFGLRNQHITTSNCCTRSFFGCSLRGSETSVALLEEQVNSSTSVHEETLADLETEDYNLKSS